MGTETKIEWADSTFNPWIGCTKVSPGCDHCYAEARMDTRLKQVNWGAGNPRKRTSPRNWHQPVEWNATPYYQCECTGARGTMQDLTTSAIHSRRCRFMSVRRRVFCASLADWLDNDIPVEWLVDLLDLIRTTPKLDWLLLTKRVGNWRKRMESALELCRARVACAATKGSTMLALSVWLANWLDSCPPLNVWIGATIVDQSEADRDVAKLLEIPATSVFLSVEPMLGRIDLTDIDDGADATLPREYWTAVDNDDSPPAIGLDALSGYRWQRFGEWDGVAARRLSWVICGGESGPGARPMNPVWVRALRDQCVAAGTPFLFKQWGEWVSVSEVAGVGPHFKFPNGETVRKVGKKVAGRILDGVEHNVFPFSVTFIPLVSRSAQ